MGTRSGRCPTGSLPVIGRPQPVRACPRPALTPIRQPQARGNAKTALRSLQLNRQCHGGVVDPQGNNGSYVLGVERPAEIVNYRSMGATPLILGLG